MLDLIEFSTWVETHSEPALAILGLDFLAVADPVTIPPPNSGGVVNADGVNAGSFRQLCRCSI